MSKIAVIYWSGTGNTEAMARAVAEGAIAAGAAAELFNVSEMTPEAALGYDALTLGCPAMGAETLEEAEFEPFFSALERRISGKKTALFGSYGWGDGQWMRDWYERAENAGAALCGPGGLMVNEVPDDAGLAACRNLGAALAG